MKFRTRIIALFLCGLPALAATPSVPGIGNFYQISPTVYRGAQPTDEGFRYLSNLGIKVVLDLREHDGRSLAEERVVTAAGMRYVNIPMSGLLPPTNAAIQTALSLLEDAAAGPVFVHCLRGADRTGAVIAAYRIDHDQWENARALKEAMADGMSSFQLPRQKYIRNFQARPAAPIVVAAAPVTSPAESDSVSNKTAVPAATAMKN
jgi:protein tyrosine phosphatase (PTP) superfamily phosphohydrolase (DUF442 family)